jgi:hypothetical protein
MVLLQLREDFGKGKSWRGGGGVLKKINADWMTFANGF